MKKKILIGVLAGGVILASALLLFRSLRKDPGQVTWETTPVTRGSLKLSVTATGTIQAIQTVEVGTQVSGKIIKIYADYNSQVKAGQLLAELDRRPLQTQLTMAAASLDNAKAEMTYQTATYNRVRALNDKKLTSGSSYDEALYNFQRAEASLKTAQLNYDQAKINLDYAFIYSPIDGVVLQRAVTEGQTVAASFSTPTLFTIAHDLTQMQVEASVDEADIGSVKEGQQVTFTVDAFPDDVFSGEVTQVRLKPAVSSNVVTYTVIVKAPNPGMKLMPGMTASITCTVKEAKDVLLAPSAALQFSPDSAKGMPPAPPTPEGKERKTVWVKSGDRIHPAFIETGLDDDINVEIKSGLKEGDLVVTGSNGAVAAAPEASKDTSSSSPFMPKPPSRGKNKNSPPPPPGG
jgi:HlyD family secretion protein